MACRAYLGLDALRHRRVFDQLRIPYADPACLTWRKASPAVSSGAHITSQRYSRHHGMCPQLNLFCQEAEFLKEHSITIRGGLPEGLVCMTSRGDVPESPARCVQRGRRGKGTTHSLMPSLLLQAKAFRWKPDDPFPIPRHAMLSFLFPAQMPTGASSQMF
eukprot:284129-Pelagomonas_calceolata.AAC.6